MRADMTLTQTATPFGFCHCGCEQRTAIAKKTSAKYGIVAGFPNNYLPGHQNTQPRPDMRDASPFKINGFYCRLIPLTQGQFVIVDASDYEALMAWNWHAWWNPTTRTFYAARTSPTTNGENHTIYMHNQILGRGPGSPGKGDHKNGVTLDCRRNNLRHATNVQNGQNQRVRRNNKSGFKGVSWCTWSSSWVAQIRVNGVATYLGRRRSLAKAVELREAAERKYFGEFARVA